MSVASAAVNSSCHHHRNGPVLPAQSLPIFTARIAAKKQEFVLTALMKGN